MNYQIVKVLDSDENSAVELIEDTNGKLFIRRIMQGEVRAYLVLSKLSHCFLPQIITAEFNGEKTVVIEEFIENIGDLTCLDGESEITAAFCELCEVLEFIHRNGIIHRDIKPSNVLVANDGHIRLIDFDAARQHKEEASTDTRYLGTKGYAAPEQFGFSQTDPTADIYALGVTMKTVMGKLADSRKYRGIIRKCTEFDPVNRYQSAAAVKASLMLGKKRYFIEAALALLVCTAIVLGAALLINRQNSNSDIIYANAEITETTTPQTVVTTTVTETTAPQTVTTTTIAETTAPQTEAATTVPETTMTSVTTPETAAETITEETTTKATTATTTVPIAETETYNEISFSVAEAYDISEEGFELISPRNEKLVPKVAQEEIEDGFYSEYFVDDYRFVDDRNIHGKWETVALMDTFDPKLIKKYFLSDDEKHIKAPEIGHIQSIEFGNDGLCFSYYNTYANITKWTHGAITNDYFIYYKNISGYYIFRIDGVDYLFVEGKLNDGDLKDDGIAQSCVVFKRFIKDEKKSETTTVKTADVKRKIISPIYTTKIAKFEKKLADDGYYYDFYDSEYKFVSDPYVIGEWIPVDYVYDYKNWVYDKDKVNDELWLSKVEFKSDGNWVCHYENNSANVYWKWTYGQTIYTGGNYNKDSYYRVGSYYLYDIDGEEFLCVEWKSGDYMQEEQTTQGWYIFKKSIADS